MIEIPKPVVLWDCDSKKIIGIFITRNLAAKYLFKEQHARKRSNLTSALRQQSRLKSPFFNFKIAVRFANDEQIATLNGKDYVISDGYYLPPNYQMKGFTDTVEKFKNKVKEKHEIRSADLNRRKYI